MARACLEHGRSTNSQSRHQVNTTMEKTKGKTKTAWRRTVKRERKELHMTWGEAKSLTKKRAEWRSLVLTSCSSWSKENRQVYTTQMQHNPTKYSSSSSRSVGFFV